MHKLQTKLNRINKCKYQLYDVILGEYQFDQFRLRIDEVQSDPFAPPSKITIFVPLKETGFDSVLFNNDVRAIAFCDMAGRLFARYARSIPEGKRGSGNGGFVGIRYGAQKVIEGNSVIMRAGHLELRVLVGLPGFGRSIAAKEAQELLMKEIPMIVEQALIESKQYHEECMEFVSTFERQSWLRQECQKKGLVAFVANGSILARASSISDKPMSHQKAVSFESPKEMEVKIPLPDGTQITGMGIPRGVTLIAGGGFHGKSTLLSALSHAVYSHAAGDGREFVITDETAVFLRAEEGRSVKGTNISPFIHNLPDYKKSDFFETENASGSSSQAANLMESLELGAKLLLIDEDISATNFLIRDSRMRELVPDYKETITPLIAAVKNLKEKGISLIMVTGALGDFMSVADKVIVADNYLYHDATEKAKSIMENYPVDTIPMNSFDTDSHRKILSKSIEYTGKKGKIFIDADAGKIKFGRETIDMTCWQQIFDQSQYGTLAVILAYAKDKGYYDCSPEKVWQKVSDDIEKYGWDILSSIGTESWRYIVKTRPLDWHAALSRLRNLETERI